MSFGILQGENKSMMRIKRTVEVAMSNYEGIIGITVFNCEGKISYASENMQLTLEDVTTIVYSWTENIPNFTVKHMPFITALSEQNGIVGVNPDGAVSIIVGTGKGVWYVAAFAAMDEDKFGILRECVQAAKNLESSVSIDDI